jgi:hypothetical protein
MEARGFGDGKLSLSKRWLSIAPDDGDVGAQTGGVIDRCRQNIDHDGHPGEHVPWRAEAEDRLCPPPPSPGLRLNI